jgi:hypothetical protein
MRKADTVGLLVRYYFVTMAATPLPCLGMFIGEEKGFECKAPPCKVFYVHRPTILLDQGVDLYYWSCPACKTRNYLFLHDTETLLGVKQGKK